MNKLLLYLHEQNLFGKFHGLVNIHIGEVADKSVNIYNANDVWENIIQSMNGVDVFPYTFKRKNLVLTMKTKSTIRIEGETIHERPLSYLRGRFETKSMKHFHMSSIRYQILCLIKMG